MTIVKKLLSIGFFVLALGCKPSDKAYEKLNIAQHIEDEVINITAILQSPEYLAVNELLKSGKEKDLSRNVIRANSKEFQNGIYIQFVVDRNDGNNAILNGLQSQQEYANMVFYLNTSLQEDFKLRNSNGMKVEPLSVSFDNTYGMSNAALFNLVFPKNILENSNYIELEYTDKVFGINDQAVIRFNIRKFKKKFYKEALKDV